MTLKKVYKYPGYDDQYHFEEWMRRTNPGVNIQNGLKVKIAMKAGKKRKLNTKTLRWKLHNYCSCCGPWIEMRFE